jgi:hypothetical protein
MYQGALGAPRSMSYVAPEGILWSNVGHATICEHDKLR